MTMRASSLVVLLVPLALLALPACNMHGEEKEHEEHNKIVATSPQAKDVTITQQYVCQIRSQCSIEVSPQVGGRLEEIMVREGQTVKKGDPMFKILPTLYQRKLEAELAKLKLAQIKLENTKKLYNNNLNPVVSQVEVAMHQAEVNEAEATANRTRAEVEFTICRAPFDGVVDRLQKQLGSMIKEGEVITTLFDNSLMWVYFNVPEARYLAYHRAAGKNGPDIDSQMVELVLADGTTFTQPCAVVNGMGKLNNETGNYCYRADFPNPDRLLRHGQTGNILIHRKLKDSIVIPQRATIEVLDKRYVFVVDKDNIVHQREIIVEHELEDVFVIKALSSEENKGHASEEKKGHGSEVKKGHGSEEKKGLSPDEKIVLEGIRQVHDGDKVEFEYRSAEQALANQKNHAE